MELDAIVTAEEFEGLGETFQPAYRQLSNEELQANNLTGVHYAVNVKPRNGFAMENVSGLKSSLSQKKKQLDDQTEALGQYRDESGEMLDPKKAFHALGKLSEIGNWTPDEKAEEWKRSVEEKFADERKALIEERDKAMAVRNNEAVRNDILRDLSKHGIDPDCTDIVFEYFAKRALPEAGDNGVQVFVRDEHGGKALTRKPGESAPRTIGEEIEHFKNSKQGAKFFRGSGMQGKGNTGAVDGSTIIQDTANMNPQMKIQKAFEGAK